MKGSGRRRRRASCGSRRAAVVVLAALALGCEGDPSAPVRPPLPDVFVLEGMAEGRQGAWTVTCAFTGFLWDVRVTADGWESSMAAEIQRRVLDGDGAGTGFRAIAADPDLMVRFRDGRVELSLAGPVQDPVPLWANLQRLEATEGDFWSFEGEWVCGPPSEFGEPEPRTLVGGSWTLAPDTEGLFQPPGGR